MSKAEMARVEHLLVALCDAANTPEVRALQAAYTANGYADGGRAYWESLAAATFERLPEGVKKIAGRKLIPGLREVNADLRCSIGKVVVLHAGRAEGQLTMIEQVSLEDADAHPLVCLNCDAKVDVAPGQPCPQCGAP